jgi:cytochrome c oxidase subunit II
MKPRVDRIPTLFTAPRRNRPAERSGTQRILPVASLLALAACGGADVFPQSSLVPRSDFARAIDDLFMLTVWLGVGVGVVVFLILGYIMWRFRYRPGVEPSNFSGNTRLELAWTFIPAIIIAIIAVPTVNVIFSTQQPAPEGALQVNVRGFQWWWEFEYVIDGDTIRTANEIHVPVGTPVDLRMTSADVIHSFWVPQMGGKRDVIPNRITHIVFTPEEPGLYMGACAEFCGESHALMLMRLIAHTPEGFEAWQRNEASPAFDPEAAPLPDSALILGKQLFATTGCVACHTVRGFDADAEPGYTRAAGRLGPDLTHFGSRRTIGAGVLENNAQNLHRYIMDPQRIKPGNRMPQLGWTDEQVRYIVAYLQTLY